MEHFSLLNAPVLRDDIAVRCKHSKDIPKNKGKLAEALEGCENLIKFAYDNREAKNFMETQADIEITDPHVNDVSMHTHVIALTERDDYTFTKASDVLANSTWLSALKSSLDHENKVMFCEVDEGLMKKVDALVNQL